MSADAGTPVRAGGEGEASELGGGAAYRIELPEFEGPLDLLLHLCKTHEIDILEIPIAFVTEKYLAYLETMQAMSVEVAAEYLVMAATLAYLKARELVPNPEPLEVQGEEGEDALDPREELIRRLLEYQKYKAAGEQLGGRPIEGRNIFGRGLKLEGPHAPNAELAEHSVWKLIESFADILKKVGPKISHEVAVDRVSLSERINQIVDRLESGGGSFRFDSLVNFELGEAEVRDQLVVTLLAVLELAKLRVIRVLKDEESDMFYIAQQEGSSLESARRARATAESTPEAADEAADEAVDEAVDEAADGDDADPTAELETDTDPTAEVNVDPTAEVNVDPTTEMDVDPTGEMNVGPNVGEGVDGELPAEASSAVEDSEETDGQAQDRK
jgi:segregation and condensation protein A